MTDTTTSGDATTADETGAEEAGEWERPVVSTRDRDELRDRLEAWMLDRLGPAAGPQVSPLDAPASNGMSSDTLLFEASWTEDGVEHRESLVARLAPQDTAVPVFPTYDLPRQARVMQVVAEHTDVPVPYVHWVEDDPAHLGAEFFVMRRVEGEVPPDVMPYTFGDSWVSDGTDDDRLRLERSTVSVLARLHTIPETAERFAFLAGEPDDGRSALRRHVDEQRAYFEWVMEGREGLLLERAFAWLEEHWPEEEGPTVLSWGDARIGNVMYRDFEPVAVFDWEMAALAPPEVDLGWMVFLHRFFQDLAADLELPGLPDFLRRDRVARTYEELTGYAPRDLDWYTTYAALRHGIVMTRVGFRTAAFGQGEIPEDIDDLVMHRRTLEAMLEGTYWSGVGG